MRACECPFAVQLFVVRFSSAVASLTTGVYHAGLKSVQRKQAYNDWIANKTQVMVSTLAFGMISRRKKNSVSPRASSLT